MSTDIKNLQKKYLKVKKELRAWEQTFQQKHHRPPTVQDIGERPNVEKYYKKYNQLKKEFKQAMEQARDEPKSASVHFEESSVDLSPTENDNKQLDRNITAEEAFWLCDNRVKTSMTQPVAAKPEERLILGGSQPIPKKNIMLEQKLFGHLIQNPRNSNTSAMKVEPKTEQVELNTQDIQMTMSDDEDDFQVLNRQLDPFRLYCDADMPSIGPGYFNSTRVTHAIPLVDNESERQRRDRILYKLEKGTLGERVEENVRLEEEMDDDIKEFLLKYNNDEEMSSSQPSSPGSTSTNASTGFSGPYRPYKKKPIQRRQTRLYKLKFVETR